MCVTAFHYLKNQTCLGVSVDKVNILLSLHENMFSWPSDSKIVDHPLWSLFGSELTQILPIAIIVVETRICLHNNEVFKSSLAKFGAVAEQELITRTNFR